MTNAERRGVVLALDYPGRRDESRIRDLDLEAEGWQVRYLLAAPFPQALTSSGYAESLLRGQDLDGTDVAAVLAYCSGAPIAQDLVTSHLGGIERVPLVLFDGEPSLLSGLRRDAAAAGAQLSVDSRARPACPAETFTDDQLSRDPDGCVAQLREWLVELGVRAMRADGADESEARSAATDIACFYLDYLVFLVAAHNTEWPAFDGDLLHVVSRGHPFTKQWPGSSSTRLRQVDCGRNDLLGHPGAREIALSFLDRVTVSA